MKKWILFGLAVAMAVGGLIFAYRAASRERSEEAERDKPLTSESQVNRGTNGETTVRLEPEAQQRLALKITTLEARRFQPELHGYGRVLDPTPLAALAAELASNRAAADASRREFERLKTLSAQDNASARALQAAEAAAVRDQAQTDNAHQRLLAAWGKTIAERKDLADLVQSLVLQENELVRIDLLAGDVLKKPPELARLFGLSDEISPVWARFISVAPAVDPQSQGQGFLFLVMTNEARLFPGVSLSAFLPDSESPLLTGVEIVREAVVRFNGRAWIYLLTDGDVFTRHEISLEHPTTNGWFVAAGVNPDSRVVVSGAQMLLSEEQKSQIRAGD